MQHPGGSLFKSLTITMYAEQDNATHMPLFDESGFRKKKKKKKKEKEGRQKRNEV